MITVNQFNRKKIILLLLLASVVSSVKASPLGHRQQVTPDFFIETVPSDRQSDDKNNEWHNTNKHNISECRANIRAVLCLVDPDPNPEAPIPNGRVPRTCLPGGEKYAAVFEKLFDFYPPTLQRMFCSLKFIYIEKKFFGTAYAGQMIDENGKAVGALMGIRQSVLDEGLALGTWASWKEQLSFGGVKDSYTSSPHLPQIETSIVGEGVHDFLYFVFAHEFGHLFDFANSLNQTEDCQQSPKETTPPDCPVKAGSWGEHSWRTEHLPRVEQDFPHRDGLCFYTCDDKKLSATEVPQLYSDLYASNFISTYAATNPWDDFADSLAYYLMDQNLQLSYVIQTRQGNAYDIVEKLKSPVMQSKFQYIKNFLEQTDIKFP
jgi:hypothetical protein